MSLDVTEIELVDPKTLRAAAYNPRRITKRNLEKLEASIKQFGFLQPVIVNTRTGVVVGGHQRIQAAINLGLGEVPVVYTSLTEDQERALNIALNNPNLQGEYDLPKLKDLLEELDTGDFDLTLTGYELDDIERMMTAAPPPPDLNTDGDKGKSGRGGDKHKPVDHGGKDPDAVPAAGTDEEAVTRPGDIIQLGRHRLMCGDGRSSSDICVLLDGATPQMANTDPPYGVKVVQSNRVGNDAPFGKKESASEGAKVVKANVYAPIIGDETTDTAVAMYQLVRDQGIGVIIFWGANYYAQHLPPSPCWIVWDKENTGNYADGEMAWTNQNRPMRIFRHMWNGMIKASEHGERRVHPTQKPVALYEWTYAEYGQDGDIVLDQCVGSGASLIACEAMDRTMYGMEMSPAYCDVITNRWCHYSGQDAVIIRDGKRIPWKKAPKNGKKS